MGNILNALKNMLANKNTITILGVLLGVVAIYFVYDSRVKSATNLVSVYYIKENVASNTQLTQDMVGQVQVNSNITKVYRGLVTNLGQITTGMGKDVEYYYVNYDHGLVAGQLLSTEDLVAPADKLPNKTYNLDPELKQFDISVDLDLTQGNSIAPGNSIDLWVQGKDENNDIIFGRFVENLEVIDVVDSNWITTAGRESGVPKYLITAVDEETWLLLKKSERLTGYQFKLVPVVRDKAYNSETPTRVVSTTIKDIIEAKTSYISY